MISERNESPQEIIKRKKDWVPLVLRFWLR